MLLNLVGSLCTSAENAEPCVKLCFGPLESVGVLTTQHADMKDVGGDNSLVFPNLQWSCFHNNIEIRRHHETKAENDGATVEFPEQLNGDSEPWLSAIGSGIWDRRRRDPRHMLYNATSAILKKSSYLTKDITKTKQHPATYPCQAVATRTIPQWQQTIPSPSPPSALAKQSPTPCIAASSA